MGRRGKDLTPEVKKIILDLSNEGYSGHKISQVAGVIPRTVNKFLKRVRERRNEENLSRPGRQRKTDIRGDRRLCRMVRENRRQTLEDLTNKFNNTSVDNLSSRTVRRRLFGSGYKRRVISKKITIRKENRACRCSFCRQKLTWTSTVCNNWCKVLFSDKTKVEIEEDKKIYAWRRCNECLYPECTGIMSNREKQGTISAMFWGCITYNGVGTIIPINGTCNMNSGQNSVKYIENLDNHLWPVVAKNFGNSTWILQEDNAPCRVSRQCNTWKADNNIPNLPWPAQSPDINVIENVWRVLKIHINRRVNYIKTKQILNGSSLKCGHHSLY
jgi:transposase-like protein